MLWCFLISTDQRYIHSHPMFSRLMQPLLMVQPKIKLIVEAVPNILACRNVPGNPSIRDEAWVSVPLPFSFFWLALCEVSWKLQYIFWIYLSWFFQYRDHKPLKTLMSMLITWATLKDKNQPLRIIFIVTHIQNRPIFKYSKL